MTRTIIAGVGMTRFGKLTDRSLGDLAGAAATKAFADAGLDKAQIDCVFSANSVAGVITGQEAVRGQIALKGIGVGGLPIFNLDNACASGASALHLADAYLAAGAGHAALVVGFEKMVHPDKSLTFRALDGCTDVAELDALRDSLEGAEKNRSVFMDLYARKLKKYLADSGGDARHVAAIGAKNHTNGARNPYAQFQTARTVDEVMESREVVDPLRLLMCSPTSDGAAALLLVTPDFAKSNGLEGPALAASVIRSDNFETDSSQMADVAAEAYGKAGITPDDIDVAEVHDATAAGELFAYEDMGLAPRGDGWKLIADGHTQVGGRIPVNPSGGLIARGHPVGATGVAQVVELAWHLRGDAGERQTPGARIGVAHNRGGSVTIEPTSGAAAMSVTVLTA